LEILSFIFNFAMKNYYLKILPSLISLLLAASFSATSQDTTDALSIKGDATITIRGGTSLTVNGNMYVDTNANITNDGIIYLSDTLKNRAEELFISSSNPYLDQDTSGGNAPEFQDSLTYGRVVFTGRDTQAITGLQTMYFNDITLDHQLLILQQHITAFGEIDLNGGNIYLNGRNIYLFDTAHHINRKSGTLKQGTEKNSSRIFDNSVGNIYAKKIINSKYPINIARLGYTPKYLFDKSKVSYLTRHHLADPTVTNGSINKFFDVEDVDGTGAKLTLNYLQSDLPAGMDEADFAVFYKNIFDEEKIHYERYEYVDFFIDNNQIYIDSLNLKPGRYTIAESECDSARKPRVQIGPQDTSICEGQELHLSTYIHNKDTFFYDWQVVPDIMQPEENKPDYDITFSPESIPLDTTVMVILKVTDYRACENSDTITIHTHSNPTLHVKASAKNMDADSTGHIIICTGDTLHLHDSLDQSGDYLWTYDDGDSAFTHAVAHAYNTPDKYNLRLTYTDQYHCQADTQMQVEAKPLPEPAFWIDSTHCQDIPLVFNNQSDISKSPVIGSILKYTWLLGDPVNDSIVVDQDGSTASDSTLVYQTVQLSTSHTRPNLTLRAPATGTWPVTLKAISNGGCRADTTQTITIHDSVAIAIDTFLLTDACINQPAFFTTGTGTSANVSACTWLIDNDTTITSTNPDDTLSYTFTTHGDKSITLIASSLFSCADTTHTQIFIAPAPQPQFSAVPVCTGDSTLFINHTNENKITGYTWDFGDGNTQTAQPNDIVRHKYDSAGTYHVLLGATNEYGCVSYAQDTAFVAALPEPYFESRHSCFDEQASTPLFNNLTPAASAYTWHFGDVTTATGAQPQKQYNVPGSYEVQLTAEMAYPLDDTSMVCTATYTDSITVHEPVNADFIVDADKLCAGAAIKFDLANHATPNNIDHYEWDFGDGQNRTTSETIVKHAFSQAGTYTVALQSLANTGCTADTSYQVRVKDMPDMAISASSVCNGQRTAFTSENRNPGMYITDYLWDFGDTTLIQDEDTSSRINDFYRYTAPGTYQATLTTTNNYGCSATDTVQAQVHALPHIDMGDKAGGCGGTATLDAGAGGYSYAWSTGATSQVITVASSGTYYVTLTDTLTGCQASHAVDVQIEDDIQPILGDSVFSCGIATLDAEYTGANYQWSTGATTRMIDVPSSGMYAVTVQIDTCTGTDSVYVTIYDKPALNLGDDTSLCASDSIILSAAIPHAASYRWSTDSHASTVTAKAADNRDQSKTYKVEVTDHNNCTATGQVNITFNRIPEVGLGPDKAICQDKSITLDVTDDDPLTTYLWEDGSTEPVRTISRQTGQQETRTYAVDVTTAAGCTAGDAVDITFNPLPQISLGNDTALCSGKPVTLDAFIPGDATYQWNTGDTTPSVQISQSTDVQVKVTNVHGCSRTSNLIHVDYKDNPSAVLPATITACNSTVLDAGNYGASYLWSNQAYGRELEIYQSGTYTVEITNNNGCSITDTTVATIHHITKPYLGQDIGICENETATLKTGIRDTSYHFTWSTGSTANTLVVASGGDYWVKATRSNGCEAADTIHVTVHEQPYIDLGADMILCDDENTVLDAGYDAAFYHWGASNGTTGDKRMLEVSDTGTYWVQVTTEHACQASDTITLEPTANNIDPMFVAASKLRIGDSVQFLDMSEPRPISWLWYFGDLQTSTRRDPVHVYYGCDTFKVSLHVSNGVCNATITKPMVVECTKGYSFGDMNPNWQAGDEFVEIVTSKVYPNPNNGYIWVEAGLSAQANTEIYIFNLMGKLVELDYFKGMQFIRQYYDLAGLPPGIYILKIIAGTDHKTYKLVKEE
jgi:PKD repeat protein